MAADDLSWLDTKRKKRLSGLRRELEHLLENWDDLTYEDKESVVHQYWYFLYTTNIIDRSESDVKADLRILKDLQTSLQQDIERKYTQYEVARIHVLKKIGMMLQELHSILEGGIINPDDEFGQWIQEQLRDEERNGYLNYVHGSEKQVVKRAIALGIPINEEKITFKEIRDENPDEVKDRLMVYRKELEKANSMPQDDVDCISRGPELCELIKKITSELSHRHLAEFVDDIK
ncbi:hypothetical protein MKX01_019845, partial [Papaver californicum]